MNILRTTVLALISIFLIPLDASAHCKGKHTGDHEHCTGGGDDGSGEYFGSEGVVFRTPSDVSSHDYRIIGTSNGDDITAGSGTDLIVGGAEGDSIAALGGNDDIYGEDGDDNIDAGEGNDFVDGGAGNDLLNGGPGTDWVEGGDGDDALFFSMGASLGGTFYEADHLDGGPGYDRLSFGDWAGPGGYALVNQVTADLALNTYEANVTDLFGETVVVQGNFVNIEDLWGTPDGNSTLYGDSLDNFIVGGGDGNDVIHGRSGNDTLIGNAGNDEVYGGPGDDWVEGHPGDDLVVGGAGNDTVSGQERGYGVGADDELWGGDNLTGVDGEADVFHFHGTFGTDTVMDYEQDELIHLTGYVGGFRRDLSFNDIRIDAVGDDIVISTWRKQGGGNGGTIILKGAAAMGITIGEQHFIIE